MRGKRSKQYRKLMQQYGLSFGFREPYQVLVDAEMVKDADKFKMDLIAGLERTLHGEVKPMITQCSMRHLYAAAKEPGVSYLIDKAKTYERRRCGHLPADYPEPLSTQECLSSVVDPKGSSTNKHRYVVASQELDVRKHMRGILGVPLVYINRSVMIMEPMADASAGNREREERGKFRDGIKRGSGSLKRKREEGDLVEGATESTDAAKKSKKRKGQKEPNPLSVKKAKKKVEEGSTKPEKSESKKKVDDVNGSAENAGEGSDPSIKRKRRRKHKSVAGTGDANDATEANEGVGAMAESEA